MLTLDVARSAYARLPLASRLRLGSVVRFVPAALKYGGTYKTWRRRIAQASQHVEFCVEHQNAALLALVDRARTASPFYRERLASIFGKSPLVISDLRAEWHRIPILTGADVVAHGRELCTVRPEELDPCITGGSSGRPVTFFLDRGRSPIEYAFVHAAWARTGFTPAHSRAVFRGVEIAGSAHMHHEPALGELRCSVFHLSEEVMSGFLGTIEARKITFLHGYPSALAIFAAFVLRQRGPFTQIRGVLPTSERLPSLLRRRLAQAFPCATIAPIYGLSEKVAFATELPDTPETYTFDPLYGLTEVVDADGLPMHERGSRGRLVSTGLLFSGMPFIRYETGDEAELVEPARPENGYRLRVRQIVPRHSQDYVVGRSGILIPISAFLQLDEEILGVGEFQFVQETPGQIILRIVPRCAEMPDFASYLRKANRKAAGEIAMTLEIVDAIPTTRVGKRKFIDQRLEVAIKATRVLSDDAEETKEEGP